MIFILDQVNLIDSIMMRIKSISFLLKFLRAIKSNHPPEILSLPTILSGEDVLIGFTLELPIFADELP